MRLGEADGSGFHRDEMAGLPQTKNFFLSVFAAPLAVDIGINRADSADDATPADASVRPHFPQSSTTSRTKRVTSWKIFYRSERRVQK